MQTMNCFQCCFKHLAGALSYGKEILSGHGAENTLDHRIDFLGQLVNLQHHLELIDRTLFERASTFRKDLQSRKVEVNEADLEEIRNIYKDLENYENKIKKAPPESIKQSYYDTQMMTQDKFTVVIDNPKSPYFFNLCYDLLRKNILNEMDIVVINPAFDVSEFQVKTAPNLYNYIQSEEVTENFIYMKENYFIIKEFDFNFLQNTYAQKPASCTAELKAKGIKSFCYSWDSGKPQFLNKTKFLEVMQRVDTDDVLSYYCNITGEKAIKSSTFSVVSLNKKLCCSNKAKIGRSVFVSASNDEAFESLKEWIAKNLTI